MKLGPFFFTTKTTSWYAFVSIRREDFRPRMADVCWSVPTDIRFRNLISSHVLVHWNITTYVTTPGAFRKAPSISLVSEGTESPKESPCARVAFPPFLGLYVYPTLSLGRRPPPPYLFSPFAKILCRARVRRDGRRAPGGRGTGRLAGGGPQRRSGHSRRRLQGGRAGHRPEGRPRGGAGGQEPDGPKVRDQRRVYAFRLFGWNMPHTRTSPV